MLRKTAVYFVSVILLLVSRADNLVEQEGPDLVIKNSAEAIEKGNADNLTRYFFKTVEIELLGDENYYSQAQALQLLKSFFERNIPVKFSINHQGAKDLTAFAIGTLQCRSGVYRISLFLKTDEGKTYIHQMRIEPESQVTPK